MRYMPYTAVLLLCCTIACAANEGHRCITDAIALLAGEPKTVVLPSVSRQRNISEGQAIVAFSNRWDNIRIRYFTGDLNNPDKYCSPMAFGRSDFLGRNLFCDENEWLTAEKRSRILDVLVPRAIKLHSERLRVALIERNIIVPNFTGICANFSIPNEHHVVGVRNADMLLYIAAAPISGTAFAWTAMCGLLSNGRPVVSVMNISPRITSITGGGMRVVAHEITHALGFNIKVNWLPMNRLLLTLSSAGFYDPYIALRGSELIKRASEYYNCSLIEGVIVEDNVGEEIKHHTLTSHWKRRNAKDELMSDIVGAGYYTVLTMAAMEDTGFYRAVFEKAEPMKWGKGAGCAFPFIPCLFINISRFPDMFCNSSEGPPKCTHDRLALGKCNVMSYRRIIPTRYRYFTGNNVCGEFDTMTECCPYIKTLPYSGCRDGDQRSMPGSRVSPRSRCVEGRGLMKDGLYVGDVCVELSCDTAVTRLRYLGDERWFNCPEGGTIIPNTTFQSGEIVCPLREDVCVSLADDFPERVTPDPTTPPPDDVWYRSHSMDSSFLSLSVSVLLPLVFLAVVISAITVS